MLEKSFRLDKESKDIWDALTNVFAQGYRTRELSNKNTPLDKIISTSQFGNLVEKNILGK